VAKPTHRHHRRCFWLTCCTVDAKSFGRSECFRINASNVINLVSAVACYVLRLMSKVLRMLKNKRQKISKLPTLASGLSPGDQKNDARGQGGYAHTTTCAFNRSGAAKVESAINLYAKAPAPWRCSPRSVLQHRGSITSREIGGRHRCRNR